MKYFVDPAADKELVCYFLKMMYILIEGQGYEDIPQSMFKCMDAEECALLITIRTDPYTETPIVRFWQIIDEDRCEEAMEQLRRAVTISLEV
ncbi:hypothetical protein GF391_02125 [Candidatus Uhrbacteria bacterium]|nr:hypothetical protein [Candidatus Uhrbacteria bacterium]